VGIHVCSDSDRLAVTNLAHPLVADPFTTRRQPSRRICGGRVMTNLAEALPQEQQRVRELIPLYLAIGPAGSFAIAMMNDALRRAEIAAAGGDVIAMLQVYEELRGFKS
jgi:hypothetical protein